jgi:hypothetical protein
MNYITITINGETIGLKFGMASFRYLTDKFVDGISFDNNIINEIGISHIIYSGYYNNCLVKNEKPTLTFENIVDWLEKNIKNQQVLEEINNAVNVWSESDVIKETQEDGTTKKKNSRGKK